MLRVSSALIIILLLSAQPTYSKTLANSLDTQSQTQDHNNKNITVLLEDGELFAQNIATAVGVSISPLLGMSALGAYNYWKTPEEKRASLKWHSTPVFWGPLLVILFLFIIKDILKAILPIPKQVLAPLDALETVENKVSALIGIPFVLSWLNDIESGAIGNVSLNFFSSVAYAGDWSVLSEPSALIKITLVGLFTLCCFSLVWLVSHTVNILILISPFATIDSLLKILRNLTIAFLLGASLINPFLGLFISLVIVILACFLASWSFRVMVLGSIFSSDVLLRRSKSKDLGGAEIKVFVGKDFPGAPNMTCGFLTMTPESSLKFNYRPWLIFPYRTIYVEGKSKDYEIGKGTLSPIILKMKSNQNSFKTLFRLRPMYKYHEESLATVLGMESVRDVTITRGIRQAWEWLSAQLKTKQRSENPSYFDI